ncbi:NUDIX domain-containing protein [Candidatus Woesearchaeota archaeon]|nr:NUDIX domain-containing protein [Candidatus Woesearchaeota archaeon]
MADHYVDIVDENDEVIGRELKSKKPEMGFISRVVAVMLRDSDGKFIVTKRGSHKKLAADKLDLAAFGNVDAGEDYETAAKRELREETGLSCPLTMLDKFYQEIEHKGNTLKIFCGVFLGHTDKEPVLNHELISFRRMTFEEIESEMKKNPEHFCQGFVNDFNKVKTKLN